MLALELNLTQVKAKQDNKDLSTQHPQTTILLQPAGMLHVYCMQLCHFVSKLVIEKYIMALLT